MAPSERPPADAAQRIRVLIGAVVVFGGGVAVILAGSAVIGGALVMLAAGSVTGALAAERRIRRHGPAEARARDARRPD